ncbi:hypothetical protein Tco_0347446 [Tanacetum coccineum]
MSITEPDYKNLNKKDIEDMYLLCINGKVGDYAETGLLWSLSVFIRSTDGYKFSFDNENGDSLVYSNGCFMFRASTCKGIYETVECISHNGNVILNAGSSNELDKSKLWHSLLRYVNKKCIAQLQKD